MDKELLLKRKQLDIIDEQILKLISKRLKLVLLIMKLKKKKNLLIIDSKREREVFNTRINFGKKQKLNSSYVKNLFKLIIKESHKLAKKLN